MYIGKEFKRIEANNDRFIAYTCAAKTNDVRQFEKKYEEHYKKVVDTH